MEGLWRLPQRVRLEKAAQCREELAVEGALAFNQTLRHGGDRTDEDRMLELEAGVADNLQKEANLQKNLSLSTQLSATLDGDPGGDHQ